MGEVKPFSQHYYDKYDIPSKRLVSEFIEWHSKKKWEVVIPPEQRSNKKADLNVKTSDGKTFSIEVECKVPWKTQGQWVASFDTVDTPYKKRSKSGALYHILINYHFDTLAIAKMSVVQQSEVKPKWTKDTKSGTELFYMSPVSIYRFFTNYTGSWKEVDPAGKLIKQKKER